MVPRIEVNMADRQRQEGQEQTEYEFLLRVRVVDDHDLAIVAIEMCASGPFGVTLQLYIFPCLVFSMSQG